MFKKLLVIIMVLSVAAAAYATSHMQHHGKGFDCYSSANGSKPCPCPGMRKGDKPCPMMKDGGTSAPCPMMKQGSAPCGKDCMKKCEKCPHAKDCKHRKDCMNRKKDGTAPCRNGAKQPCPCAKDATK